MDMKAHQEELKAHYQILRCDLHPRLSNNGKRIFVDFVENANRNIGIFET